MATRKTGLDYFPFKVDFFDDDKIQLIESEFGIKGSLISTKLLCKIYKECYFYKWGVDECMLFASKAGHGIEHTLVSEVVNGLVRRSFFDKTVYDSFGILTSKDIQVTYFEAVERRKSVNVEKEILLVDVGIYPNVHIVSGNVNIINANVNTNTQKRVEESKGKESMPGAKKRPTRTFVPPDLFTVENYFLEKNFSKEVAARAFSHYAEAEPPWHDTNGHPVRDWKQKMRTVWMKKENKTESHGQKFDKAASVTSSNLDKLERIVGGTL